jgi:tungstate transport system ATP-binding protein
VLLLDEPTANLDPVSTARIEELVARVIGQHRATIVLATHDMAQGQRLADRAALFLDGEVVQAGTWREVFDFPRNSQIAAFVGVENIFQGVVVSNEERITSIAVGGQVIQALSDYAPGQEVSACIRSEEVTLALAALSSSARNSFAGEIARVTLTGPVARIEIDCGFPLVALVTRRSAEEMGLERGKRVHASFKATAVHVVRREAG